MQGLMPHPKTPEQCNELFNRTGAEFRAVFSLARKLGVKTCIGTETPLTVPAAVREHLKQLGKDPADPAVVRELYDGIFKRIAAICPVDYYWLWTPEGWTWGGNDPAAVRGDDPRHPRRLRRPGGGRQAMYAGHLRLGAGAAT